MYLYKIRERKTGFYHQEGRYTTNRTENAKIWTSLGNLRRHFALLMPDGLDKEEEQIWLSKYIVEQFQIVLDTEYTADRLWQDRKNQD